ncbi:DHX8 [Mytilus edulis]|uniref:DHX8 n=1 Tax=Mytilus edulis TaxID=6550 RepID=A0A8S3THF1_MYTED|nr:DHX8 [Mytilus edulis]
MLFKTFSRNVCHYLGHEKAGYLVVKKEQQVQLFPASSLKSLGLLPNWIVIEQVLKTSRDFAVNVTTVLDEWIQEAVEKNWLQLNSDSLSKQRVELLVMFEVGEQVFREFVGPRYSKLRELENSFKETSNEKVIILEASKEVGEISLYTQQNCNQDIGTIVRNRVDKLREKMQQDKSEQFLSSTNTGVRVVIGSGLNVGDVLMVDEYKTIFITGIPKFLEERSEEEITKMFERYGKIVKKKEDAERAVNEMREGVDIKARPSVGFQNTDIRGFRTKLQWCRRPSRGFGFVKFTDLTTALRTRITPIAIGGTMVRIKPSKNGSNEVHVANLNPHVNEDVLRQGFMDALGLDPSDIARVSVIRHKVNTPQDMIHMYRQRIRKK